MELRGINYDTGFGGAVGHQSRVDFDPAVVAAELRIIARDLHCNTVRISGDDPERIAMAGHAAIDVGLRVWFAPFPRELTPAELIPYFEDCARRAEDLRVRDPATVLVLGCEISLFCKGFLPGAVFLDRIAIAKDPAALAGFLPENDFSATQRAIVAAARGYFGGRLSYAAGDWEEVDWSLFDFAGVDLYRSSANAVDFAGHVRGYETLGKPLIITEFGCCTYQGAQEKGGIGWAIIDYTAEPYRLDGDYVRDESVQVCYFTELMDTFESVGVHGAFWFTFAGYHGQHESDPRYDLDLASYGVVKVLNGRHGKAYPDMAWEPKEVFHAIAKRYARTQAIESPADPRA